MLSETSQDRESPAGGVNRCSLAARSQRLEAGGTASPFEILVLVERPLPWPPEITEAPDVARVAAAVRSAARGRPWRLQTIVGDKQGSPPGRRRVVCYWRHPDLFDGFRGAEVEVDEAEVPEAALMLMTEEGRREGGARHVTETDVLVCGHGARDRCCGSFGTRLALAAGERPDGFRIWRTSHTGGHRFAPTAMVLPYGDAWGYLDEDTLDAVLRREVPPRQLAHLHRGSAGMATPGLQLLDRFAMSIEGWSWQLRPRRGIETPLGDGAARVRLEDPSGTTSYEGVVGLRRTVALPVCGGGPGEIAKSVPELELLAVSYPGGGPTAARSDTTARPATSSPPAL